MIKKNPFCNDLESSSRALSGDKDIKYVWVVLPPGADAACEIRTKRIFMPKMDVTMLTEEQARILSLFDYHEHKHLALSDQDCYDSAKATGETLAKFMNILEDARIELNDGYSLPYLDKETKWYRAIELRQHEMTFSSEAAQNPWGALMTAILFKAGKYGSLPIPSNLKRYWDVAWDIMDDGRFEASTHIKREGNQVTLDLAKEILAAWNTEKQEQKQNKSNSNNESNDGDANQQGGNSVEEEFEGQEQHLNSLSDKMKEIAKQQLQELEDTINDIETDEAKEEARKSGKTSVLPMHHVITSHYIPYTVFDKTIVAKPFPSHYNLAVKHISSKMNFMRATLSRLLMSRTRSTELRHRRSGKLDRKSLTSLVKGDLKIFKKTTEGISLSSAVQLVIDFSGSMHSMVDNSAGTWGEVAGTRSELAAQVAILFGEVLDSLRIPFEIIGFNSESPTRHQQIVMQQSGATRVHDVVNKWIIKEFKENYHAVKYRLGACLLTRNHGGTVGGCNVDHEVILWGAGRLWAQPEQKKIQIVLSDGLPSGCGLDYGGQLNTMLKAANRKIEKSGIFQFCLGMSCQGVKEFYKYCKVIDNLQDLDMEAMKILADALLNR